MHWSFGAFFLEKKEHPDSGGVVWGWTEAKGHRLFSACSLSRWLEHGQSVGSFGPLCPSVLPPPLLLSPPTLSKY